MTDEEPQPEEKPKHGIGERIREHLQAAEVAAEESAAYGWVTEAVEAVEAAVNPKHELGPQKHDDEHVEPDAPSDEKTSSGEPGETTSQG
jgi:hypothetical protein